MDVTFKAIQGVTASFLLYYSVLSCPSFPVSTKHLYNICTMLDQRRRSWADVVQMLYKYFVFTGFSP